MINFKNSFVALTGITLLATGLSSISRAELKPEPIPNVATLDANYSQSTVFATDVNFNALIAGRVVLLDVAKSSRNYLGALDAAQFPTFIESREKPELYVGETFYSRGTRGDRTDVVTIYDKQNLALTGEIILPGRGLIVSHPLSMQLVDNDRYLLVFNITPAASVIIIDTDSRKVLNEASIPGCGLIVPTGPRGFSTLCGNGSMYSAQFDQSGSITEQHTIPPFFNIDEDPLLDKPVIVDNVAMFATFKGEMQPIDLSSKKPVIGERWSLVSTEEKAENWRPGGWMMQAKDDAGLVYFLMHKDGYNGSHKGGGTEVWVFDPKAKKRVARHELKQFGVSLTVTRGDDPFLVVTNEEMQIDVYKATSGEWIRVIGGAASMPLNLMSLR